MAALQTCVGSSLIRDILTTNTRASTRATPRCTPYQGEGLK
jgi:hypothetical protein